MRTRIVVQQQLWLIWELTKREIAQRYRGTLLGMIWPVLYASLFLAVFLFVFTVVLRVRWVQGGGEQKMATGALMIFAGTVPYFFVAEVMGRGSEIMYGSANLVKRVRFPLHLIPVVTVNAALAVAAINMVLLLGFGLAIGEAHPSAALFLPLILLPLYTFALGLAWLLSASAVFFRDLGQIAPVLAQVMMFMAPVFYPRTIIPSDYQYVIELNPLTYFVDAFRSALGGDFDGLGWLRAMLLESCFAAFGSFIFIRLRPAFGDIL
jgi:lipopolysaccharide transport system permease protein